MFVGDDVVRKRLMEIYEENQDTFKLIEPFTVSIWNRLDLLVIHVLASFKLKSIITRERIQYKDVILPV